MPVIKSAIRRQRVTTRKTAINKRWRSRVRRAVKGTRAKKDVESLKKAQSALDRAARRGVIKRGKAARLKSRLSRLCSSNRPRL